jgi:hypothetical protein
LKELCPSAGKKSTKTKSFVAEKSKAGGKA